MARRRKICLLLYLVLASVFVYYTRSFVYDLLRPFDDRSHLLAKDALRAARDVVQDTTSSLLEAYEDELRTTSKRNAVDRSGTKSERSRHQAQVPPHRNATFLHAYYVADGHRIDSNNVCRSLAGKRITMIGGEHVYRLHLLLLRHRERAEGKPFPCRYREFCTHHHICLPPDQHAWNDTPTPMPRYIKPPMSRALVETGSAVVNYIVSDTLLSAPNASSWEYNVPFVDPMTGIRLRETYWLPAARKANVVVLGRGPLSAPGQTYTGDWSFLREAPDYVDVESKSRLAIVEGEYADRDDVHGTYQTVPRSLDVLNAAVHLTVSRFLPDMFQLLRIILLEVRPSTRRKTLIWPSSWCRLPGRGVARAVLLRPHAPSRPQDSRPPSPAEHVLTLQLSALVNADVANAAHLEDPWTLLFNAQVYLQNVVLEELLPRFGVVFLPLDVPFLEGTRAREHGDKQFFRGATVDIDLERMKVIGETFWTELAYVLGHPSHPDHYTALSL